MQEIILAWLFIFTHLGILVGLIYSTAGIFFPLRVFRNNRGAALVTLMIIGVIMVLMVVLMANLRG